MVATATPSKTPNEGKKATAKLPSPPPPPMISKSAQQAGKAACACAKSALVRPLALALAGPSLCRSSSKAGLRRTEN